MFFRLSTLGCKVNQYETEIVRTALLRHGYIEADEKDIADLVVVNTCTVTAESEAKSRKLVRKLANENPGAKVIAMGCAVTHRPDSFLNIGGNSKNNTVQIRLPPCCKKSMLRIPNRKMKKQPPERQKSITYLKRRSEISSISW